MDGAPVLTTAPLPSFRRDPSECFQNETSPLIHIAQPPPMGPPPPLPLPPPLPSSMGDPFTRTVQRRSKMRNFNWDAIPRHSVLGKRNVWTAQRNLENFELDTKRMEELFSHNEHHSLTRQGGMVRKSVWGLSQITTESKNVSILNSKKSMNIGILLKQFKRPPKDIVEAVRHGNLCLSSGKLKELSKLLPDDMETKKLLSFNGDLSPLNEVDRFMVMLVQVPGYKVRIKCLLLREEFFPFIEEIKHSIAVMTTAANELLACDDLHSIIRLVLKAGNYMNAGGYAGSAIGFRMTSLLKLVDTKANKPGINLMHYVSMQAQQIDEALLHVAEQLQHIGIAARIQKQEVEMDFQRELEKIREAKMDASKQPDLLHQMEAFLRMADIRLADVEASLQELENISTSVAEYFCEDPATFKLEECCSIFHSFCERFERATQENREREAAETRKRQRREREMLNRIAKCRSTSTCTSRDVTDEVSALESVLTSFLHQRPSRRRPGGLTPVTDGPIRNIRPQVEEREGRGDLDSPVETNQEKFSKLEEPENTCLKEEVPPSTVNDIQRVRAASKRAQCIDDELIPESDDLKEVGRSNISTKKEFEDGEVNKEVELIGDMDKREPRVEEDNKKIEEEDKIPELSSKSYHFQDCVAGLNGTATPDRSQGPAVCTSATLKRNIKEVDLALQDALGSLDSPWTILSPSISPCNTPHHRHSYSFSRVDILDDGVWAFPDTPVRDKPSFSHNAGMGTSSSLPDCPSKRIPAQGTFIRSASLGDEKDLAPNFKLGQTFQRRTGQELPPDKRPESSGLVSFFRRFGERNHAGSVG
ncbi:FH2 domain-containing protein 1-like [Carassius auratus]|uniref:FH2 domain-containing protein 1-like n=1 Tax=Carassius auratus TaxID=7957 RepID=A0A6P6KTA5_CARAU|nr:FH2 domain-containing protein 1-like [Carassius auratus]